MPDAAGLELIAQALRERIPESVVDTSFHRDQASLIVTPEAVRAVLGWLAAEPDQSYTFLSSVHGADYLPAQPRFGVHYELLSMDRVERIRVKALLTEPADPEELPEVDSVVDLFATAEFQEREIFDMFGIRFRGHPDLRRILMPEDYEGWPQRRDFPLGGEPVLFTHNEPTTPRWYR